jgi:ATP-dependent Clp protease adapter protein ClpS
MRVDGETSVYKKDRGHRVSADEVSDSHEKWALQLFDDSSNTRSYVSRCLVQLAGLSEEDSYRKTMHAHERGMTVVGEYCREHADHYKEALTSSGLVCEIFPVEA